MCCLTMVKVGRRDKTQKGCLLQRIKCELGGIYNKGVGGTGMTHCTSSCPVYSPHNWTCSVRPVPFSTTNYSWY